MAAGAAGGLVLHQALAAVALRQSKQEYRMNDQSCQTLVGSLAREVL